MPKPTISAVGRATGNAAGTDRPYLIRPLRLPDLTRKEVIQALVPLTTDERVAQGRMCGLVFDGLDLSGLNFGNLDLDGSSFRGCDLRRCDFSGSYAADCDFSGAQMDGFHMTGGSLDASLFLHAHMSRAKIGGVSLEVARFDHARIWDSDLGWNEFSEASFRATSLCRVDFTRGKFGGNDWSDADFTDCDFSDAVCTRDPQPPGMTLPESRPDQPTHPALRHIDSNPKGKKGGAQ